MAATAGEEAPEVRAPWWLDGSEEKVRCVVCYAKWDLERSGPSRQLLQLVSALAPGRAMRMDCEEFESICEVYGVTVVPTLLVVRGARCLAKREGAAKAADVRAALARADEDDDVADEKARVEAQLFEQRLKQLVATAPVMVFMKGTPDKPRCGFSRKVCEILRRESVEFSSFDILRDRGVREGLKKFADWPTYPQIYKDAHLIGGLDILEDSIDDLKALPPPAPESVDDKLQRVTTAAPVVVFIKGTPDAPRCGFSKQLCDLLALRHVPFSSFDVLRDPDLRHHLKTFSNWPTFPQVYVHHTFVGGLDILAQLHQDADDDLDFKRQLGFEPPP